MRNIQIVQIWGERGQVDLSRNQVSPLSTNLSTMLLENAQLGL